ncbi:MAG: hypothetical protein HY295_01340 [Thaumarchaeota archaeon]|nr:hypothetical protein [Nitrososphaerota archaeon]
MDEDHRTFEKELAKLNAYLTIVTTGSSVVAGVGISLLILGITLGSEAISKTGDENRILTTIGTVYSNFGVGMFVIGMIVLVIAILRIPSKIDKL